MVAVSPVRFGGDPKVLIDDRPAAKVGSPTKHCGGTGTIIAAGPRGTAPLWERRSPERLL